MKKVSIIFLTCLYMVLSCGFSMNMHYCGGKLKKVSLFSNPEKGCCGSKKMKKGCCKNKTAFVKVDDSHQLGQAAKINSTSITFITALPVQLFYNLQDNSRDFLVTNYHAPPVLYDNPLYLVNRVFLI